MERKEELAKQIDSTSDPEAKKGLEEQSAATDKLINETKKQRDSIVTAIDEQLGGGHASGELLGKLPGFNTKESLRADRFGSAANGVLSGDKSGKVQELLKNGRKLEDAMSQAGLSEEEQAKMLDKIREQLSPEQLLKVTAATAASTAPPTAPAIADSNAQAAPGASAQAGTGAGATPPAVKETAKAMSGVQAGQTQTVDALQSQTPAIDNVGTNTEKMLDQIDAMTSGTTLNDLYNVLWVKGIKINQSFLKDKFWKEGHDQILDANREALLEYFFYKDADKKKVLERLKSGASTMTTLGKDYAASQISGDGAMDLGESEKHATGGYVTGIRNGIAQVQKAPSGEGFASIGPGERIVPKNGGGGGNISIHVNGVGGNELANVIKGHVMNGIAEYNRRNKFS